MDQTTLARRKQYTTEFHRRDTVRKLRESGLSQAEFSRREGLQEWQVSNWKRHEEKLTAGQNAQRTRKKESEPAAGRSLPRQKPENPVAEIAIGDLTIRIWPGADRETLASPRQALKEYALC